MSSAVRSFLAEPAAPDPPARVWWDWLLLVVIAVAATLETIFRTDLIWVPSGLIVCVGLSVALLWRRTHPLLVTVIAFGGTSLLDTAAGVFAEGEEPMAILVSTAWVLMLPYALLRWGSGRDAAIGMGFILGLNVASELIAGFVGDLIIGAVFFLLSAELGALVRSRVGARVHARDQIGLR